MNEFGIVKDDDLTGAFGAPGENKSRRRVVCFYNKRVVYS